jgi:hypothetical protein
MVGMQIVEAQLLAKRAWHLQWARCILTSLALIFAAFEEHRRASEVFGMSREFAIIWGSAAIIFAAYMTEQTWHAWRQLQFARKLTHALTPSEFERAKAQEEWHNAVRDMLLLVAVFSLIGLTLRGNTHAGLNPLLLFSFALVPAARVGRLWRELRRVSA